MHRLPHVSRWWIGLAAGALILWFTVFRTGIALSATSIWDRPEYGHGLIIPFISAYLIWKRRGELGDIGTRGSWGGIVILVAGMLLNYVGARGTVFALQQYGAVVALVGLICAFSGSRAFAVMKVPLALLLFTVPLPEFLYQNLSAQLQLISSQIGVWLIRGFGIPVYLEGNVIDLGAYKLQVAEACDGLRYLFPLMTIGFIVAYLFPAPLVSRVVVFLSSIPLTILMNSFRIGVIGVMVEHWGTSMAEGFVHDFQGWAVFMVCIAILGLEVALLSRFGGSSKRRTVSHRESSRSGEAASSSPMYFAVALLFVGAFPFSFTRAAMSATPPRESFDRFPLTVNGYSGQRKALEAVYSDTLRLDDYLLVDFSSPGSSPINLYVAWYASQEAGRSAHSPRSCLPAGGWAIESFEPRHLAGGQRGNELVVNRALIKQGDQQVLVYYWFLQRGRNVTNEYAVKWYLLTDALTRNRTDGALVRLTAMAGAGENLAALDEQMSAFAQSTASLLGRFVPD